MSNVGYIHCACRDCFETTIGPVGTLCAECTEAGCDAFYTECRAYSADDARLDDDDDDNHCPTHSRSE